MLTCRSYERLAVETDVVGYPVFPLISQLVEQVPEELAKYIHWGATTQDIMDNASVLQIKQGLDIVKRQLHNLINHVRLLSEKYRDTSVASNDSLPMY